MIHGKKFLLAAASAVIVNLAACGAFDEPVLIPMSLDHTLNHISGGPQDCGFPILPEEPTKDEELTQEEVDAIIARILAQTIDTLSIEVEDVEKAAMMEQFFEGTLFIGDSRTVGMARYGKVTTADYFAETGMSVFNVFKEPVDINGLGEVTLEQLLSQKKYDKIYIMLGINELGYSLSRISEKYSEVVALVRSLQPEADICLQANLHVSQGRSDKDPTFNNIQINALNEIIKGISEEQGMGWLDVNPIFDDENGALTQSYTFDHTHVLGKYYRLWAMWIYNCESAGVIR